MKHPGVPVGTLKTPAFTGGPANNPNAVKVSRSCRARTLFSRARNSLFDRYDGAPRYFKHLAFNAYRKNRHSTRFFSAHCPVFVGTRERLEQLRFLENGIPIQVWAKVHTILSEWIPRMICAEWKKLSGVARRSKLRSYRDIMSRNLLLTEAGVASLAHSSCCGRSHAREIAGCDWKNHSTHRAWRPPADFCSASLFMDETKARLWLWTERRSGHSRSLAFV